MDIGMHVRIIADSGGITKEKLPAYLRQPLGSCGTVISHGFNYPHEYVCVEFGDESTGWYYICEVEAV